MVSPGFANVMFGENECPLSPTTTVFVGDEEIDVEVVVAILDNKSYNMRFVS